MDIRPGDPTDPRVLALLQDHLVNMRRNSPPARVHALAPEALSSPDITFWCGWSDGVLAGCGALKELSNHHGEIKSMMTSLHCLRQGVASTMLRYIITEATARGYRRLSLETGSGKTFVPAQRLYCKQGFEYCGPFAQYVDDGFAVFMTKEL